MKGFPPNDNRMIEPNNARLRNLALSLVVVGASFPSAQDFSRGLMQGDWDPTAWPWGKIPRRSGTQLEALLEHRSIP
jgi:hypothetical protein